MGGGGVTQPTLAQGVVWAGEGQSQCNKRFFKIFFDSNSHWKPTSSLKQEKNWKWEHLIFSRNECIFLKTPVTFVASYKECLLCDRIMTSL